MVPARKSDALDIFTSFDDFFRPFWDRNPHSLTTFNDFNFHEFVEDEKTWSLVIPIPHQVTDTDVVINVIDDTTLEITYDHKDKNSQSKGQYKYTIPTNTDVSTLVATIDTAKHELQINIEKVEEKEEDNSIRKIKINKK